MFLTREFKFCAAHYLPGHHKCGKTHGHNYRVQITIKGDINKDEMVVDFSTLKNMVEPVIAELDHAHLNYLDQFKKIRPTVEQISIYLFHQLQQRWDELYFSIGFPNITLYSITVYETDDCWVTYCPNMGPA